MGHGESGLGFEGFDGSGRTIAESELRKEGIAQSKIWICLGVFMTLCLFIALFLSVKTILLRVNGNSVTVDHKPGEYSVTVYDTENRPYYIQLNDVIFDDSASKLTLYYYGDDIKSAKLLDSMWFFVVMDIGWGAFAAGCFFMAYRNIKPQKKHAVNKD